MFWVVERGRKAAKTAPVAESSVVRTSPMRMLSVEAPGSGSQFATVGPRLPHTLTMMFMPVLSRNSGIAALAMRSAFNCSSPSAPASTVAGPDSCAYATM